MPRYRTDVFTWTCPICGKIFSTVSQRALEVQVKEHYEIEHPEERLPELLR